MKYKLEIYKTEHDEQPIFRAETLSQESLEEELGRFERYIKSKLK